ncbi:hypothetical protein FQA39_LY18549 [Lamprigera yunnana]|nr:hypothetical protein FQA39_LY18549 [Lamprigera yunnana]
MDMVVSETLRKWPPVIQVSRICVQNYLIEPVTPLLIEKGSTVSIPIIGIHRDEKLFPNSKKFDPERFSDENKLNIKPFSYVPFGSSPRNCIEIDTKDISTRFTNDAIATAAFGINLNSLEEKNNDFYMMGKDFTNFSGLRGLKIFGYTVFPALMRFF